ncbi:phage tail length tape measure family protein (plasmid) [Azospirillum sp. HJ39]|uniref:phage tail length tape measure family protein n=1 Tax=Azospirillum sp. HJ39 TaxID=3159496 RepID=UPI0035586ACB
MEAAVQVVGGTTDRIDRNLSKVDRAFDRLEAAARGVTRTAGAVKKDLDSAAAGVGSVAERINRSVGIIGRSGSTKSRAADIEAWGRELDRLEAKFDPATTATKRYEAELADLENAHRGGIVVGDAYQQQLQRLANEYDPATIAARKLREEAEKEAAAFRVLEDRLDSHGAAARKAAADQADLDAALADGRISYDRYTGLSRALREQNGVTQVVTQNTKLAAHEITNLSYQLQDAAVQLAGGQNPLLVLMQQGPQATGAVGGVGRAMALLTSPAGVAAIAVGSVAAGLALVVGAAESHQRAMAEVSTATRLMGDRVGMSADQLERLAERAAESGSITVAAARQQEAAYIRAGNIGTASMEKLIALSRDYAAATKQDSDAAQADLAALFADPVAAAEKLQSSYGILNAAEMQHVRQLKATGQEEAARVLVADKLAVRVRGLADNTTTFAQAWERVGRAVSGAFDAVGKAASPETNAEAIRRLERERQQLIQARNLDRSRIDAETGGTASDDAVPVDSRFSAPGMGGNGSQRLQQVDAELNQRRTAEARAREQAAIRKNNQDRDRFGVEAAEITRAARPLGTQIDDVTEKVTKLRRAFGPDMAGASDETKRALGGFEAQLADLRAAETKGVDVDAYKRQQQAAADAKAASMVGVARERFLATEGKRIELIGTATSATERQTQVDQAGAAVTNNQTAAIAQQNAQTEASIRGAVASADAYRDSLAAGIEADARRQAQSEAVTSAVDVEARTRQIVAEKAGEEAVSLAQATKQLDLEAEAQQQVVAATDDGIAARMEAERVAQVAKATSAALAAAQAAEATGNTELAKKLRELAAGYDAASKKAVSLSKIDALKQYNQQQRDGLELQQVEASLTGASADSRARSLALYQAEVAIRQQGIDVSKDLTEEEHRTVEQTRQLAAQTVDWKIATDHAQDAWKGVGEAIDDAVVRPLESVVDALVKGQGEALKLGDILKASAASLVGSGFQMGLINPLKNELGFEHSASLWDLPMFGGSGQQQVIRNKDGSTSFAPAVQGAGGSWLSQPVFGQVEAPSPSFVGPMPAAEGIGGWNPSWGQVIQGVGGIAGGIATATQKGATTGQMIGGGLMGVGGAVAMIPGGVTQIVGGVMMAAGALLSAVSGAKDRGDKYSISHITLGANGKYSLGAYAQDNDGDPTRFNADAAKVAKGLNDISARLNLTPKAGDSYIDTKTKSAEEAALELLKGMQSAVPEVAYALAHETSLSLEEALAHLEFANSFDRQIAGLRSSISDLFEQFQSGVDTANTFGKSLLDVIDTAQTVFTVTAGSKLPGFATGTLSAPSGWAVVGEEGPEVVRLSGGERIWNARESAQMIAGLGQGRDDTLIHLRSTDELSAVRRALGMRGKVNPVTGLLGFDDSGDGVGSDNSPGGERDTPGSGTSQGDTGSGYGVDSNGNSNDSGGFFGGFVDAIGEALDGINEALSEAVGLPAHETQALAGMVGVIGTAAIGGMREAAATLGGFLESTFGGDAPSEAGPGDPGGTASGNIDPGVLETLTRLRDVIAADPNGEKANALIGAAAVGGPRNATVAQIADAPWKIFSGSQDDPLGALAELDTAAQQLLASTGQIPDVLQRALDGANAYAAELGIAPATAARQMQEEQARQKADALQIQFDAVGLVRSRVSELNDIVVGLGNNTFSPIGKDFDQLAADMKKAADAYVAAGQAVPDGLFGAMQQMEALGAVRKRLLDEVAGVTVETSPEEQRLEQLRGQWSATATDLVKAFASVGIVGDELAAKLNQGFNNALRKEQSSYSDSLDTTFRKSKGEEGYDSAVSLIDAYKTSLKDVTALWPEGTARADQMAKVTGTLVSAMEGLVKSGSITSTSLQQVVSDFADTPAVVTAATAALKQLNDAAAESTRQFDAGVTARAFSAVGNDRASQLISLDEQQKKELMASQDAGYDVSTLVQVQASERATKAFELANADLLGSYDQRIAAEQDLITGLQDGAVAVAKIADQFQKARDSLAISDDAPISPQERLAEAERQWGTALTTLRSDSASKDEKDAARSVLTQIGPTLVSIEKTNSAGTARSWYDTVMGVFAELGDKTALGVDTADQQLEAAQDALKELQKGRSEAANANQKTYGALTDLKNIADQSKAEMLAALKPLERLTGTSSTAPHYSAPAQVQAAWDGLSTPQQFGIARSMGWGGQVDDAFNIWLASSPDRAAAFGTNVTSIAGGARYGAPDDVQRAWEALTEAQQLAAVRTAGYDGGIDAGLNAWVQLGHAAAFEAAVRAQAHTVQVPGFASGGFHAGGLRVVGERGAELEATGPARIWTADQIATAMAAARGELGPSVVGFLPSGLGGSNGMAALVKAMAAVGGKIDSLSDKIEGLARTEVQQQASIAADLVDGLAGIKGEVQELPRRIAGAM